MQTYMLRPTQLAWPTDWSGIFEREAPLFIEIGFGNADFLVDLAQRNPEANILGLEISYPSFRKGRRKRDRQGLSNVRLLLSSAQTVLWALFSPGDIQRLYVNFPDPWPKPSHQRRRLINDRFLQLVATRIVKDGHLYIATDHAGYAEWIADCLSNSPNFDNCLDTLYIQEDSDRLRTKYELKAMAEGRLCYYFNWRRNYVSAANDFPIPLELPMPHVILSTPLSIETIDHSFVQYSWSDGFTTVRIESIYYSKRLQSAVVDTYISELPAEQRLLLAITHRKKGEVIVHLHEAGFPRPTPGVHFAIKCLVEWLIDLNPTSQIIDHNIRNLADVVRD
jgi:tRNA (guanine-N7-)-methyltransferase